MAKTLVRIFEENDGFMGCEVMLKHLDTNDSLKVVGMLEKAKSMILRDVEDEEMTNENVKSTRKLLD